MAVAEEIDIVAERAPDILTLPRLLRRHARTRPNAPALRQKRFGIWSEMSWSQYERAASHFAQGIIGLGYGRGDHLAILSENRREWVIAELGMHLTGAVAAGVYATSPAAEILHVLNLTEAKAIICEDQEQVDKVLEIRDQLPQLRHIIYFDGKGLAGYDRADLIAYDDLIDAGAKASQRDPGFLGRAMADHDPDDVALIVCTSGSTGPPKAALITFRNIAFVGAASARNIGQTKGDSAVSYLPLCHVAEQLFSVFLAMHAGYVVSFGESLRTVQSDLREIAPTIFLGVPRIWEKMRGDVLIRARSAGLIQGLVLRAALRDSRRFDDPWKTNYGLGDRFRRRDIQRPVRQKTVTEVFVEEAPVALNDLLAGENPFADHLRHLILPHLLAQFCEGDNIRHQQPALARLGRIGGGDGRHRLFVFRFLGTFRLPESQNCRRYLHGVAILQLHGHPDARAVDQGAVPTAKIHQIINPFALVVDQGMPAGDFLVVDRQRVLRQTPYRAVSLKGKLLAIFRFQPMFHRCS